MINSSLSLSSNSHIHPSHVGSSGSSNTIGGIGSNGNGGGGGGLGSTSGIIPTQISVGLRSPSQSAVTSSFSEYRFKPEVVTTSNRIQESCI